MPKLTLTNVFRLHNFSIKNDTLGHLWQKFMGVLLITASQVMRSQLHKKWSIYWLNSPEQSPVTGLGNKVLSAISLPSHQH